MFLPESGVRVWLHARPTDMRKSFDGLAAQAKRQLGEAPASGQLFVFINRRQTQMKILYFDRSGYCLWSKRLEQGRFHYPRADSDKVALDLTQLKLLIEGIELDRARRSKRYGYPTGS